MEKRELTAFISYSWDSAQHQQWVLNLMNRLRSEGGVNATMDIVETQSGTVNLNTMMVKALRDYDYVIMVLTERYAKKADELMGGVGYETELSLPELRKNPNKFILIARDEFGKVIPFHLQGYHALDFTEDKKFESSFLELLYRIQKVPMFEVAPVGDVPDLKPMIVSEKSDPPLEIGSDRDEERIVWLLPRGFLLIEDIAYRDESTWNVKAEFWNYDGHPIYGVHYKPEYHEIWMNYERRFRTLQIPEADWYLDEYYLAVRFIKELRERGYQEELEGLVQEKKSFGHHVFYYEAGVPIYLPTVPSEFKALFETGELRDILNELRVLHEGKLHESERMVSMAEVLRLRLETAARKFFKKNDPALRAILKITDDFDANFSNKKIMRWLDRAAAVLNAALEPLLRNNDRY